jgi:hypothetical protein
VPHIDCIWFHILMFTSFVSFTLTSLYFVGTNVSRKKKNEE